MTTDTRQFWSAKDIASLLGVTDRAICKWAQTGADGFPAPTINRSRCKRWRASLVRDWIAREERRR